MGAAGGERGPEPGADAGAGAGAGAGWGLDGPQAVTEGAGSSSSQGAPGSAHSEIGEKVMLACTACRERTRLQREQQAQHRQLQRVQARTNSQDAAGSFTDTGGGLHHCVPLRRETPRPSPRGAAASLVAGSSRGDFGSAPAPHSDRAPAVPTAPVLASLVHKVGGWRVCCFVLRTVYVCLTCLLACIIPFFGQMMGLVGAIGSTPTNFILPCLLWLTLCKPRPWRSAMWWLCWGLVGVGVAIGVLGAAGAVYGIVQAAASGGSGLLGL